MKNNKKTNPHKIKLSLVILTGGRDKMLKNCLDSVEASVEKVSSAGKIEVILAGSSINGGIKRYIKDFRIRIKCYELGGVGKSRLRNYALDKARGEIVYFIDDDLFVESDFISKIIKKFREHKDAAVIGGPNLTPPDSGIFEKAQGCVLSLWWGAAQMHRRYREFGKDIESGPQSFALCNLGFRVKVVGKNRLFFDERLNYNEETELLARLENLGHKMIFTDIRVYHYRRRNLKEFIVQVFESGCGRAKSIKIDKLNFGVIYFLPALFVFYLLYLPLLFTYNNIILVYPFIFYLFVTATVSLKGAVVFLTKSKVLVFFILFILFFTGHLSYGVGIFAGFFKKV